MSVQIFEQPAQQAIRDLAYENEIARRRKLNNIPEGFLTPNWLELAIAKDWTPVRGELSEVRARAEAEARTDLDDWAKREASHRAFNRQSGGRL